MNDPIREEFRKGQRLVPKIKNEDKDSKKYWQEVFAKLDTDVKIPQHKRIDVLQDVFEDDLLRRILKIVSIEGVDQETDLEREDYDDAGVISKFQMRKSTIGPSLKKSIFEAATRRKLVDYRKKLTQYSLRSMSMKHSNMYSNFLNLPESMAAKWRPKPPITFTGMSLSEKCEAITLSIATDFVEWLKGLGGDEATTLDVPVIMNLFEIGFNAHAADSLCVSVKELLSVTKSIANARYVADAAYTSHLYKQLYRDINSIRKQEDMFAFGTMLPIEMRQVPQKDNIASKWIQNKRVPENIASMAVVWEGIEHLRSTHGYCQWLLDHPEVDPPAYLQKAGLLVESQDVEERQIMILNSSISVARSSMKLDQ